MLGAMPADARDQLGRVPLMHQHQFGVLQHGVEIQPCRIIKTPFEFRIGGVHAGDRCLALILAQLAQAPAIGGLIGHHLMAARLQLTHDAAQEVGIAVIPVRYQRVIEQDDAHGL
jgi:hypothetical protein